MRRLLMILCLATILGFSAVPAEATHFRRWYRGHHFRHFYPRHFSFSFYYPRRVFYPRVYYPRVYYPRVVSYSYPYYCGVRSYSTYHYGYVGNTFYSPSHNFVQYNLPTVSVPAELNYGPQAVKQFMGVSRNFALGSLLNPTDRDALVRPEITEIKTRVSNAETLKKARKYLANGDALFRRQKYHSALQEYKAATRFSPELAEGYLRQGHALVATSRFELAAAAFKRALKTDPEVVNLKLPLDELYGDAKLAKTSHLETLASAALESDREADLMFLLGVFLHYDGQTARATKFFKRAFDLAGADRVYLAHFLPRTKPEPKATEPETRLVGFTSGT